MGKWRAVLDTNVLEAAFRSKHGATHEILRRLRRGEWIAVLSNHLLCEYEEVLKRDAVELNLTLSDIDGILDAVSARGEEWPLKHGWKPVLSDPDDEPIVQLAFESGAMTVVTHNLRHFEPAKRLDIRILKPNEFLDMLKPAPWQ